MQQKINTTDFYNEYTIEVDGNTYNLNELEYLSDDKNRYYNLMRNPKEIRGISEDYVPSLLLGEGIADFRESIHPKKVSPIFGEDIKQKPYYQVFSQKYGFISGLSALDLLFNEGPEAYRFLKI